MGGFRVYSVEPSDRMMQDYRRLRVWQDAHRLTLDVYAAARTFPKTERFGLTSQLQRAAASVPANLAEGCGRGSDADFARFVQIAVGSATETDYHLLLARDLGHLSSDSHGTLEAQMTTVRRQLIALLKRLRG